MSNHYQAPDWMTQNIFNRVVARLTKWGFSVRGSRVLEVRGRTSGLPRRTPVNLLDFEGEQYLVAPRGETEWVRNVRTGGGDLTLLLGRHRDERTATELADTEKPAVLRAYLRLWKAETGKFFGGVGPNATDQQLAAIAEQHPVFRLNPHSTAA